jgi:hypothetical protein
MVGDHVKERLKSALVSSACVYLGPLPIERRQVWIMVEYLEAFAPDIPNSL